MGSIAEDFIAEEAASMKAAVEGNSTHPQEALLRLCHRLDPNQTAHWINDEARRRTNVGAVAEAMGVYLAQIVTNLVVTVGAKHGPEMAAGVAMLALRTATNVTQGVVEGKVHVSAVMATGDGRERELTVEGILSGKCMDD